MMMWRYGTEEEKNGKKKIKARVADKHETEKLSANERIKIFSIARLKSD
jgi:hypothetical protein